MKTRMTALLITMLIAAFAVVTVAVEAVRTGKWELGSGGAADDIPDSFYGDSFLPDTVLDNAAWIVTAAIVWIVVAALLMALTTARSRNKAVLPASTDIAGRGPR